MVSYSSQDAEIVEQFAEILRKNDLNVWLDKWAIHFGSDIVQEVEKGIDDAEFLILMLSRASIESGWVEKEWRSKFTKELQQKKTKVICVKLEDCEIPTLLASKKYVDAIGDPEKAAHELVDDIKRQFNWQLNAPFVDIIKDVAHLMMYRKGTPFTDVKQEFEALSVNPDEPELAFKILSLLLRNKELTYELILERTDQPHENDTQPQNFGDHVNRVMQASSQVRRHEVESKIKQVQEIITTADTLAKSLADLPVDVFNVLWNTIVNKSADENEDVESNLELQQQISRNGNSNA
ncbi:toll/interleukin-1 receptor domain-containing protein [Candidatus Thiosymbion oneisti]|uniref:toll/interleukin-1 receptor domain-containing protein n=1 Tax=Candidatus Thiosymbion oneisti TaxID=589554 RepID=UPI001FB12686|nr:toll/interleukin-1 receptor domain-containing protein [Candidatus Thiosymbion oneisti]